VRSVNFALSALALLCTLAASVAQSADFSTVYIARRGWHIDIGLAVADLTMPLAAAVSELPRARYVFFGFGDRHYLLAKRHGGPTLLRALWPGDGIILVTGLEVMPDEAFGAANVVALVVSEVQLRALQGFIVGSFGVSRDDLRAYREGPYAGSLYYLASPTYSAVHTCNTWGAEVLQASGFNVRTGIVFAGQLWSQVKRLQHSQAATVHGAVTECARGNLTDPKLGERPASNCAHEFLH
jgi:Protein of unknown function (DUF2459)